MTDTTDKLTIQAETPGVAQATDQLNQLAGAMGGVSVQSEQTEKSTVSLDSKFASLERSMRTTGGQASQFEKVQNLVNAAVAQNPELQDRANAVLAVAEQRYGGVSQALEKQRVQMEQLASVQKSVNQVTGVSATSSSVTASRGADIVAYGKQLDDLRAKYNPLFAAGQQYKSTLAEINTAAKVGALTEAEAATAIIATKSAFVDQVATLRGVKVATDEASASHAALSGQAQTLGHAIRGGIEQLALGVSPTRAVTSEMNHLAYAMTAPGGLSGAFGELTGFFGKMITPMRLVAGGAVGIGAAALYLGNSWSEAQAQVDRAVIGMGAATGATAADLNNFTKANSSATGLSVADARNVAIEFTKTGNISVQSLKGIGEAIHGYAVLTGKDATEATKDFAAALSGDLVKGAEDLNKTYAAFDSNALDYIQTLQVQGERSKAIQFITDSIAPANQKAADSVGVLTKAYQALSNAMSLIKNGPPAIVTGTTPQERLQQGTATKESAGTSFSGQLSGGFGSDILSGADSVPIIKNLDDAIKTAQKDMDEFGGISKEAFTKLSTDARGATEAIFPQIEQIRKLEIELSKLQEAKDKGAAGPNADAAITAYQNQIAGLQQSVATADVYNQRVKEISQSWGAVDQQTALALQSAQNQLPVYEAVGGAARMAAQYTADYKNYMDQGKTSTEATALAASNLAARQAQVNSSARETLASLQEQAAVASARTPIEAAIAQGAATTNALLREGVDLEIARAVGAQQTANAQTQIYVQMEKTVQASRDQVALAATQGTAEQASVKAAIAYRNAIDAGADSTQAGIIATNTATVATAQWADQAQRAAEAFENAARAAHDAQFSDITPGGDNSFGFFQPKDGIEGNSVETLDYSLKSMLQHASVAPPNALDRVNSSLTSGKGIDSTLASIKNLNAGTVTNNPAAALESIYGMQPGQLGLSKSTTTSDSDIISQVQALYDLKNSQTSDAATKTANMQEEMAWLQSRPETLARDQAIAQLTRAMKDNTDATGANTASLNPLYNGRDALHVGYYKAASGLDMIAQGPPSGDQVPFHAMVNGGERIRIMTAAEQSASSTANDNRRNTTINISVPPAATSSARRVQRQVLQGFGQGMAALG